MFLTFSNVYTPFITFIYFLCIHLLYIAIFIVDYSSVFSKAALQQHVSCVKLITNSYICQSFTCNCYYVH